MKKRIEKYKIRHWGDDTNCKSIQELKEALLTKYLNLSVAIHFEKRGIIWVRFITIKNNQVLNSYGDESLMTVFKNANKDIEHYIKQDDNLMDEALILFNRTQFNFGQSF